MIVLGLIIIIIGILIILFTDDDDPANSYKIYKYFQGNEPRNEDNI